MNPSNALVLTGVMAVGGAPRAFVRLQSSTSILCLGFGGRCEGEVDALLPEGWSVVVIDLEAGLCSCLSITRFRNRSACSERSSARGRPDHGDRLLRPLDRSSPDNDGWFGDRWRSI